MATSNVPGGMDHPTVVPTNFESVEDEAGRDEQTDAERDAETGADVVDGDDAGGTVPGTGPH